LERLESARINPYTRTDIHYNLFIKISLCFDIPENMWAPMHEF
jgi:hypothetical protein